MHQTERWRNKGAIRDFKQRERPRNMLDGVRLKMKVEFLCVTHQGGEDPFPLYLSLDTTLPIEAPSSALRMVPFWYQSLRDAPVVKLFQCRILQSTARCLAVARESTPR